MSYAPFLALFLFSFSALSFEILLTRIFSISLWHHFAFMVVSIAMLGIGAGGTILALRPALKEDGRMGLYGLLFGLSIPMSYLLSNHIPFDPVRLSWDRAQLLYIGLYYLILSIPFLFFGLVVTTALAVMVARAQLVYGADLLGAGIGSLCLLYALLFVPPETYVLVIGSVALIGAGIIGKTVIRILSGCFILLNIILSASPDLISPRMSPYKGLQLALQYPGAKHLRTYNDPFSRVDLFRSPAVRFAPGLSLTYLEDLPEQIGISIDGGDVTAVTSAERMDSLRFLEHLPSALPHVLSTRKHVLVLEPRGGLEALLARWYGSARIHKVESLPLVTNVMQNDFRDFSGALYGEDAWTGLGRSWLKRRNETFDLISLSLTGSMPSGLFGTAEDYRLTVEAFKEYIGHLGSGGVFCISTFILPPPRIELRLIATLATALEEMGIGDAANSIAVIRSWGTVLIMAKKTRFTQEELRLIRDFSKENRFDLVLLPDIKEKDKNVFVKMPSSDYADAFARLVDPGTRRAFQDSYLFDIRPVRDEDPFAQYYLKLKNLGSLYSLMDEKWQFFIEEGYLLPAVFLQALLLSLVLIAIPALPVITSRAKAGQEGSPYPGLSLNLDALLYFAAIGLGFMFVEVSLIHKAILPLENPPYAVASVLTSLLISSGIGSLLSDRVRLLQHASPTLIVSCLVVLYSLNFSLVTEALLPLSPILKVFTLAAILFPLGLFMGIPFPMGIRTLAGQNPRMIPWAWAVNGCISVIAPIATVLVAMATGFRVVLWIGAAAYLLAYASFLSMEKRTRRSCEKALGA